jgi:asparagine synthase (glutamine-hydrolysing)
MTPLALESPPSNLPPPSPCRDWTLTVGVDTPTRVEDDAATTSVADAPGLRILFDGGLDDANDLRQATGSGSECPDAHLVLRLYRQAGTDGLARLRGGFAFVLLDARQQRLVAMRDPIGVHPLYVMARPGTVSFAASPWPLLRRSGRVDLNRAALADHLCHRWPVADETYFADVRRVLPGSRAVVENGRVSTARHWDPAPDDRPVQWHTRAEVERFDEVFSRAVDRCLARGRAGIFLSGGLDSIGVAAVAADRARRHGSPAPLALSLGFDDPTCDERPTQRAAARLLGLDHTLIGFDDALGPTGLFEQALALNARWPFPVNNTWNPAYMALAARGRAGGAQTILTGTGGDEWLTVSAFLAADLIRAGDVAGFARFVASWRRSYPASLLKLARSTVWTFGARPLVSRLCYRAAPVAWDRRRLRRLVEHDPRWVAPDPALRSLQHTRAASCVPAADPPHGFYLREMRTGLEHPIVTMELEERHEVGRRLGLQFLHPFWDADLVDLLFRTPPALLDRDGRSKGLIRQTLEQRFPELGLGAQKKVAATSFHQSLMLAEAARLRALVGPFRALGALGVVDPVAAAAAVDRAFGSGRNLHHAWDLLNLETWTRTYLN